MSVLIRQTKGTLERCEEEVLDQAVIIERNERDLILWERCCRRYHLAVEILEPLGSLPISPEARRVLARNEFGRDQRLANGLKFRSIFKEQINRWHGRSK